MRNNGIKVLAGSIVLVVCMIIFNSKNSSPDIIVDKSPNNFNEAIASEFNDNIRDVSARLVETEKKLDGIALENKKLRTQVNSKKHAYNPGFKKEIDAIKNQLNHIREKTRTVYPTREAPQPKAQQVIDLDEKLDIHEEFQPTNFWKDKPKPHTSVTSTTPYYTIPAGSDFSKVALLSALVGEVPVEGKLLQPLFPFSAMVSSGDLMTANGMELPEDITGMKVSGYAIGVGSFLDNISCVRAYVTSALFVFDDGHFVSVGKEQMKNTAELVSHDSIGYLTSPYGNPCIKGQYITNAPQVFTSLLATGGIKGAGEAISKWQVSYQTEGAQTVGIPSGSLSKSSAGMAASGSTQKISEWLDKRIQSSFDMVFVPASQKLKTGAQAQFEPTQLSLHFSQTITIDKDQQGRVLDYGNPKVKHYDSSLR